MAPRQDPGRLVDPGAAAERTRLAWTRTAMAFGAVGALLLHLPGGEPPAARPAAGVLALLAAAALYAWSWGRYRGALARAVAGRPATAPAALLATAALATLLCLLTAASLLLQRL